MKHFRDLDCGECSYTEEQKERLDDCSIFGRKYLIEKFEEDNREEEKQKEYEQLFEPCVKHFQD